MTKLILASLTTEQRVIYMIIFGSVVFEVVWFFRLFSGW